MKESFLCYESGDSLFLIMLDAVLHILEAPADGQDFRTMRFRCRISAAVLEAAPGKKAGMRCF